MLTQRTRDTQYVQARPPVGPVQPTPPQTGPGPPAWTCASLTPAPSTPRSLQCPNVCCVNKIICRRGLASWSHQTTPDNFQSVIQSILHSHRLTVCTLYIRTDFMQTRLRPTTLTFARGFCTTEKRESANCKHYDSSSTMRY